MIPYFPWIDHLSPTPPSIEWKSNFQTFWGFHFESVLCRLEPAVELLLLYSIIHVSKHIKFVNIIFFLRFFFLINFKKIKISSTALNSSTSQAYIVSFECVFTCEKNVSAFKFVFFSFDVLYSHTTILLFSTRKKKCYVIIWIYHFFSSSSIYVTL
jgi:hypothetical protein